MKISILLSLLLLPACVDRLGTQDDVEAPSLHISGSLYSDDGLGTTSIYIENEKLPFHTTSSPLFAFAISDAKLQELRHERGGRMAPLRLYFYSEDGKKVGVSTSLMLTDRGRMSVGLISLLPEIMLSGTVDAINPIDNNLNFIEGAEVSIGRNRATTDENGEFCINAPQSALLPVTVTKASFLLSEGMWKTDEWDSARNLRLYQQQIPTGQIDLPDVPRTKDAIVRLLTSGTTMSRWVRIASNPEYLQGSANAQAPWMSLDSELTLPSAFFQVPTIYYQFADEERSTLGPILKLERATSDDEAIEIE